MSIGLCSFTVLVVDYNPTPTETHPDGTARPTVPQQSAHFSHVAAYRALRGCTQRKVWAPHLDLHTGAVRMGHPTFIFKLVSCAKTVEQYNGDRKGPCW
jgi:hypothetical protein